MIPIPQAEGSSFRDPSGVVFYLNKKIYRQINISYQKNYDLLMGTGLYDALTNAKLLIPHEEVELSARLTKDCYKVIKPEQIAYISYPYEWCFEQLKDAALTTIKIQKIAQTFGMSLKDANAFNIQFHNGCPVLIDTLSFEKQREGEPWVAYRQYCHHFLAPLALAHYKDIRLNQLLRIHIDGVPIDLASSLLPFRSWLNPSILMHLHLHAQSQKRFSGFSSSKRKKVSEARVSSVGLKGIIDSLERTIGKLKWKPSTTEWGSYYSSTNYENSSMQHKKTLVRKYVERLETTPKTVLDLGGNTGVFTRLAMGHNDKAVCIDIDPMAVQKNYTYSRKNGETNLLPLLMDLTNPSPAIGWANSERMIMTERTEFSLLIALALIHHLAITNNLPFYKIADFFSRLGTHLIIEFPEKKDSQVQKLLSSRKDIFENYNQEKFEEVFSKTFKIIENEKIHNSNRILYLMTKI